LPTIPPGSRISAIFLPEDDNFCRMESFPAFRLLLARPFLQHKEEMIAAGILFFYF
jgi:hypothetical protein